MEIELDLELYERLTQLHVIGENQRSNIDLHN